MFAAKFPPGDHLDKADHNQKFSAAIDDLDNDYRDWRVTANFYSAVHTVQAYLRSATNHYPDTHHERDRLVASELSTIHNEYRDLKSLSVNTRYLCTPTNDYDVDQSQSLLEVIRTYIDSQLP